MNFWQFLIGMFFGGLAIVCFASSLVGCIALIVGHDDMLPESISAVRRGIVVLLLISLIWVVIGRVLSGVLA